MRGALIFLILGLIFGITCPAGAVKIYQWTDENGVVHAVDDPDKVPPEYRRSADVIDTENTDLKTDATILLAKVKAYRTALYSAAGVLVLIFLLRKLHGFIKTTHKKNGKERYMNAYGLSGVESMDSIELRRYVMGLLKHRGYTIVIPRESMNPVVDFIAEKEELKYAVHVYNQNSNIPRVIVNDIEREKARFDCNRSMIITRQYCDDDARELGVTAGCALVDKNTLARWIYEFHKES